MKLAIILAVASIAIFARRFIQGAESFSCPQNYLFYEPAGICVGLEKVLNSQPTAGRLCRNVNGNSSTNGTLVMPYNQTYNEFLTKNFQSFSFWLGVAIEGQSGYFVWEDGETNPGFAPWAPGHPINSTVAECVLWVGDFWEHRDCNEVHNALCMANMTSTGVCPYMYSQLPGRNLCARYIPKPLAAPGCHSYCEMYSGYLAIIQDASLHQALKTHFGFNASTTAWIGLNDTLERSTFLWPNGQRLDMPWWLGRISRVQPPRGPCFYFLNGEWFGDSCSSDHYSVCQFPLNSHLKPNNCSLYRNATLSTAYLRSYKNKAANATVNTLQTMSIKVCALACLQHQNCGSFNFNAAQGSCELMSDCQHPLRDAVGFDYWE